MKLAHLIKARVFIKEEDNEENVLASFKSFFPFDIEKEKIAVKTAAADGFEHKKIKIIESAITKEKHTAKFLEALIARLSDQQKELVISQAELRFDDEINLFLRFDKPKLVNENQLWLTDSGNCFHIKISIAAFPAKKEKAMEMINRIFLIK